jgi:hypothetical protein
MSQYFKMEDKHTVPLYASHVNYSQQNDKGKKKQSSMTSKNSAYKIKKHNKLLL